MPEKLRLILPVLTLILGLSTTISGTIAVMQTVRLNDVRQMVSELRVDVKALQVTMSRNDNDLDRRVTILETSIKGDTAAIRESVVRLENAFEKHLGSGR